jgi:hypothetical protein
MDFLFDWWNSHVPALQFFYVMAVVSFVALVLQSSMMLLGMGHDGDVDMHHGGEGIGVVSVRTITAFFVGFGWTGVLVLENGGSLAVAVPAALAAGAGLMFLVHYIFSRLLKLQTAGNISYENAVGKIATVYVTVQPNGAQGGQVELLVQGRLRFVDAVTEGEEPISTGTKVRVKAALDSGTLLVEKLV